MLCWLAYETSSFIKMRWNTMFITAVCVIFLIKLRWPKNKSLYDTLLSCIWITVNWRTQLMFTKFFKERFCMRKKKINNRILWFCIIATVATRKPWINYLRQGRQGIWKCVWWKRKGKELLFECLVVLALELYYFIFLFYFIQILDQKVRHSINLVFLQKTNI